MYGMRQFLSNFQQAWQKPQGRLARKRTSTPRLEPLEVRTLLAGEGAAVDVSAISDVTTITLAPDEVLNQNRDILPAAANTPPVAGNLPTNTTIYDTQTYQPLGHLIVRDPDTQNMLAKVTVLNGTVRGDFTPASTTGFTRTVTGNNITYSRYYSARPNVGDTVQTALRSFVFVPRTNAVQPNTTELTDFTVFVNDGMANVTATTRLTVKSINDAPTIGGAISGQTMSDNQTKALFTKVTVNDPDTQALTVRVIILDGPTRGDFTPASAAGWTRKVDTGKANRITYERSFPAKANNGALAQAAIRTLVFQPRNNVPVGTKETTNFTIEVKDGLATRNDGNTSVITTGVAPRQAANPATADAAIQPQDIQTIVIPTAKKHTGNPLARLLKPAR